MFPPIDWDAPWYRPWRDPGETVSEIVAAGLPLHEALNRQGGSPVRFVEASALPPGQAYERYVFDTGDCPTRENLHDFFNGLCWLRLPQSKKQLNALHARQIGATASEFRRGPVRDAITILDENGAVLQAPPELWQALLSRDWQRLFIELRPLWSQARLIVFGHALLEKLLMPRKELTAHVWAASCPGRSMEEVDEWLSGQLTAARLIAKPFTPLPLLGIPGWCPENQNFSFYDDSVVFRPARRENAKTTAPDPLSRP